MNENGSVRPISARAYGDFRLFSSLKHCSQSTAHTLLHIWWTKSTWKSQKKGQRIGCESHLHLRGAHLSIHKNIAFALESGGRMTEPFGRRTFCGPSYLLWIGTPVTGGGEAQDKTIRSAPHKHTYLAREIPWSWRRFSQVETLPLHYGRVDTCDNPKCGLLECVIFVSGGLRSRYPLTIKWNKEDDHRPNLQHDLWRHHAVTTATEKSAATETTRSYFGRMII